jgi:exonuclease SbcD
MKLLHTADWHLFDVLHRFDRTPHLRARVERIAALCEEHGVDVLVIAGDLFSDHSAVTYERMTAELEFLRGTFAPFFRRGGTILAITGNHDKDTRTELVRVGMKLAATTSGAQLAPGRMYLQNRPALVALAGVQFALVPYPTLPRYSNPDDAFQSAEEVNRAIASRVEEWVRDLPSRPEFNAALPSVLIAHLHVRGTEAHPLYKLSERDDICFDSGFIPHHWAYVALGHIHKAQTLGGANHIRYCGPLDRLDFGERTDDRGAILAEIGPAGLTGEPRWLPLEPTTMLDLTLDDPAKLDELAAAHPERETALVRMTIRETTGKSRPELQRLATKHFPNLVDIHWIVPEREKSTGGCPKARADYRETVREYLKEKLASDKDAAAVLALAETFLAGGTP